ncbi:E3 ubiquitin-protein ligase RNF181 [Glycine soja]|uniref:RING-type E3 ubiquitin transferase n=1 Tax=Glycine soja TaxID=3848 RepID=A0A445F0M9_GLYSO|nr:E3 ubiquitin-protein ligase RNF181 [Glycine soja]
MTPCYTHFLLSPYPATTSFMRVKISYGQFDTVPPPPPSEFQCREIPLFVKIFILNNGVRAAAVEEESTQCSRMISASNEAIQSSLKKCMVTTQSESCCPICLEELNINAESYTMPCHHLFHLKCIVSWLQTSHVCPLCRYPLPTQKKKLT